MSRTVYDEHAAFYVDFIDRGLASENGYVGLVSTIAGCLGDRLSGARVLDLCCGEGYLGRRLLARGARQVVGIDMSAELIAVAKTRAEGIAHLSYRVDDAQGLASVADGAFDIVASQMAMMDVADHCKLFSAVRRCLAPGGAFVFSLLHPCFQGRPFHVKDAPPFVLDEQDQPIAYAIRRYATEGYWQSGGTGVRGHMGSYHRMISTYVNDLLAHGFVLERMEEPLAGADASRTGLNAEVPTALVIAARAA